jgi:hypothetical protein
MSLDTKKHKGVENILYYIYISNQGFLGKCGRKDIGGCWKGPKKLFLRQYDHVLLMFGN